jgi:hypothetical protein
MAGRSIADTIVEFAAPLLRELADPPSLPALKQALELAISVWNAHVMALPEWGHPEQLDELTRLVSISASPVMESAVQALDTLRRVHFAEDKRVVRDWEVTIDDDGRARFDCTAQAPAEPVSA